MKNNTDLFTLGEVLVTPSHNEIEANGKRLRLQPKVMEVLCYLALHQDRVIANDELTEQVWQGRIVTQGSVQKSITQLRQAFAKLLGEREVIVHYSKRGYQLQMQPEFLGPERQPRKKSILPGWLSGVTGYHGWLLAGSTVVLILLFAGANYLYTNWHLLVFDKSHRTQFDSLRGYTSEVGHERGAEPHPDNRHLLYIREAVNTEGAMTGASQLVLRNDRGEDWFIADSSGSWLKVSWSPDGQKLAAVELIREAGQPLSPDFYSTAARLYDVHIFSLDLDDKRVLERHRLSQWHGQINSVTWWDDDTIELVAKQGQALVNRRYRYSLQSQKLEVLDALDFIINPLLTRVQNKRTALASLHNGATRIDFLTEGQRHFVGARLNHRQVDVSWLPDGSGVLVYSEDDKKLTAVYRNGQTLDISLPHTQDTLVSGPRYSADGQRIYFTQERPRVNIWLNPINDNEQPLTENSFWNYAPRFSSGGDTIAYVSVRNNQPQIWLIEDGRERQLSRQEFNGGISDIVWAKDGEHLAYKAGHTLYLHNLADGQVQTLSEQARDITPLAVFPEQNQLLAVRVSGEARNLWRIDYKSGEASQLTFGSLGSVVEHNGDSYFQYTGQNGLWVWRSEDNNLELLTRQVEQNSNLLHIDHTGLYYITGGKCRESDIFHFGFSDQQKSTYLDRDNQAVTTASFHPQGGALFTYCYLPEADIMVLE